MKNPFRRKRKPQGPPTHVRVILDLPRAKVEAGVLMRIDEDGPAILEPAWQIFNRLNVKFSIEYDPYVCHDLKQYWTVTFKPEYSYRGRTFGSNGTKVVREIGLIFPNKALPWGSDVRVQDDGHVAWRTSCYPEPEQIAEVVNEASRQVTEIIRDYGRAEAIMKVAKAAK